MDYLKNKIMSALCSSLFLKDFLTEKGKSSSLDYFVTKINFRLKINTKLSRFSNLGMSIH